MKKYLELFQKDLILSKYSFLLIAAVYFYAPMLMEITLQTTDPSYAVAPISAKASTAIFEQILYYSIFTFIIFLFLDCYHPKGLNLLIMTRYQRKDVVFSRYFLLFIFFFCILLSVFIYLISFSKISSLEILPIFLLSYAMYALLMSFLIPITFWFKNFYFGSLVGTGVILIFVILMISGGDHKEWSTYTRFDNSELFYSFNQLPIALMTILFTTIFLIFSICLSVQIFKRKEW